MYINNIKKDFYDVVIGERCMILVNFDIDAICACRILQTLFRYDNTIYSVFPVKGIDDLKKAYSENCSDINYFILINCGGTIDIIEILEPDESVTFFIIDSHRPIDVCNIYSDKQVCILGEPPEDVPEFDDIFCDDTDEETESTEVADVSDQEDDGDEDRVSKRQRLIEENISKRRNKRLWEEKRDRLMFEYLKFSYYGKSSALILFELAWKMSKDSMEALWWAIVGITEQMLLHKIENEDYVLTCQTLQEHVSRLMHAATDKNATNILKIFFERDLKLAMYRHWTVDASMRYTMYTSCQLRMWTLRGESRFHELLAEMGLPLVQSRQNFNSMDLVLRKEFLGALEKSSLKYGLHDIVYGSFTLHYGYRIKYCASDFVYAMLGVLETIGKEKNSGNCFMIALDFLTGFKKGDLSIGIEKAKKILSTIFKQVQYALDMRLIYVTGPFIYLEVPEGGLDVSIFSHPHCLLLLAQFAIKAFTSTTKNRKALDLPLVCSAPYDAQNEFYIIIGIPPIAIDSPKNFFGKAFEKAASNSSTSIQLDYFDSSVARIPAKERTKFLDALIALLS